MSELEYPIVIAPLSHEEGGGYLAHAPDLPGCMGDGETRAAALADIESAILEWIDEAKDAGMAIPKPGSMTDRSRSERAAAREVVLKQEKLIKSQDALLQQKADQLERLRDELESLKETLESLQDDDSPEDSRWAEASVVVASFGNRRRHPKMLG